MRCPLLCKQKKEITGKWCSPCGYEKHQQRNWLGSLVFNCLESVPLHPNTTPYYQKYAPNFRNNPRATRPSWLQEPDQARPQRAAKLPTQLGPEPEVLKQKTTQTETETNRQTDTYEHKKKELQREYHLIQPFLKQKNIKNLKAPAENIITTFGTYRNKPEIQTKKPIQKHSVRHLPQKHESKLATNQVLIDRYSLSTDRKKKQMVQERKLILQFCQQKNAKNLQSKELPKTLTTKFGTYFQGPIEPEPKFTKKFAKMLQGTKVPEFNALLKSRYGLQENTKRENKPEPTDKMDKTIKRSNTDAKVPGTAVTHKKKMKKEPKHARLKTKDNIHTAFTNTFDELLQDVNPEMPEQHRLLKSQHILPIKDRDKKKRTPIDVVGIQPKFTANFKNMLKNVNPNAPEEHDLIKSRLCVKQKSKVKKKKVDNKEINRSSVDSSSIRSRISIIRTIKYRSHRRTRKQEPFTSLDSFDQWNLDYMTKGRSRFLDKIFNNKEMNAPIATATSSHSSSKSLVNEEQEATSVPTSVGYILPKQSSFKLSLYEPIRYPLPEDAKPKKVAIKRHAHMSKFSKIGKNRSNKSPSSLRSRKTDSQASLEPQIAINTADHANDKKKARAQNSFSLYDFQSGLDIYSSKSGEWLSEKRSQLAAQISKLMKLVEVREDVPHRKKRERNFVQEAQTQLWQTKQPRTEKIAKKKRSKFPTKLEKLRIPSDSTGPLKPLVIRRYRRRPELQATKHSKACTCVTCKTCKLFNLGKTEADTPLIREMKAKGRRMQLQNYYRLLLQREACKCKRLAQSVYRCGKEQHFKIICP